MEWWQLLLIGIASIGVGLLLGIPVDRLIKRFAREGEPTPIIEEPLKDTPPDLVEEMESNRRIAALPWTGKLLPFQCGVWDAHQDEVDILSIYLRRDLTQVYTDIRLANSIVRLSTDFSHRTSDLDNSYVKLCASITERLNGIKPIKQQPGE